MPSAQPKVSWMTPGAPRVGKPSWLRLPAVQAPTPLPVELLPSMPPPRSSLPSVPPPSSFRNPPQIQTTRELELESEVVQLHNELQRVTSENASMKARVMEEAEPAVIALAVAIAKRVVGRELTIEPELVESWVREAQGTLPKGEVTMSEDGLSAAIRDGASSIEVSADARVAAIADALGVDR